MALFNVTGDSLQVTRRTAPAKCCLSPNRLLGPSTCNVKRVTCNLVLFLSLSLPLRADVFWRLPKTADTVLQQMGGVRVYTTDVQVNGGPGTLSAFALDSTAPEASASLARRLGLPPAAPFGATFITHVEKDRLRRLFVLPAPASAAACVVLSFDQSLRDFAQAQKEPVTWPAGIPALNATPLFSATCTLTRTTFVTADTSALPETALQEAAQTLCSAGWQEVAPATATFKILTSGKKQCVLLALRNPKTERTTISVLQREGATP
jgi:hypothetical protein